MSIYGKRFLQKLQNINITIEKGLSNGYELTIPKYGDEEELGAPSDLKIKIIEIPTQQWQRLNKNLIYKMKISYKESVLGFTKILKHLDGQQIPITRNQVTTPDTIINIPNKGIPNPKGAAGNLQVKFTVVMDDYTDNQLNQWEDFFDQYNF